MGRILKSEDEWLQFQMQTVSRKLSGVGDG